MLESSGRVQLAQSAEGDNNMLISCRRWKDDSEAVSVTKAWTINAFKRYVLHQWSSRRSWPCLARQPIMNCVGGGRASYPGTSWPGVMECHAQYCHASLVAAENLECAARSRNHAASFASDCCLRLYAATSSPWRQTFSVAFS